VFNWIIQYLGKKAPEGRCLRHYNAAEGSIIQRSTIATAMSALESNKIEEQRVSLPKNDQAIFMTAFGCFVVYWLKHGLEIVLDTKEVESVCNAV
jgi:hypothetical protein